MEREDARQNDHQDEKARIRDVLDSLWAAIRDKDAEKALRYYHPQRVQFSMAPPLRLPTSPGTDVLEAWFDTWQGPIGHETRDLEIFVGGDVAFCTSLGRMLGTKTDGERVDLWFRATFGLCKVDDRWKIVHEHESVPFYMDGSDRAALDLRP